MNLINPYFDLYAVLQKAGPEIQEEARKKLIWAYSWAVPSEEAIRAIAELSPIIEIGAGSGYWAWLLTQAGAKVRVLDHEPLAPPRWLPLDKGGPQDVSSAPPESTLLLCWPPLGSPLALDSLKAFRGSRVVYVGEWDGKTAEPGFHQHLRRVWKFEREIEIPCWPGFEDRVYIFKKKTLD